MNITKITHNKKAYLPLLLLADEEEAMLNRYLERGTMYVLDDGGVKAECVVTDEGSGILEIKNLAVEPAYQKHGYGRTLIDFIAARYKTTHRILQVGTGDSPSTVPFYEKCGFTRSHMSTVPFYEKCGFIRSHIVKNFFTDNYSRPIYDGGVLLKDMVYLRREI